MSSRRARVSGGGRPRAAEALLSSAQQAFDSGVVLTSAIGVVLMLLAAGVVLRALRTAV